MSIWQVICLHARVWKYRIKHRLGIRPSTPETYERVGDWLLLRARDLHARGLHGYENDIYQIGVEWADGDQNGMMTPDGTKAVLAEVMRVLERATTAEQS